MRAAGQDVSVTSIDIGLVALAVLALVAVAVTSIFAKAFHHDEVFTGITPGTIPPSPDAAPRQRLRGLKREYDGEIAVAFAPPKGLRPALAGTVVDGSVDSRDLTAMIIDLAVRGHLHVEAVPADAEPHPDRQKFARTADEAKKTDWIVTKATGTPGDTPVPMEQALIDELFQGGAEVRFSQLDKRALQALRETQAALYREVVERRWYRRHPKQRGGAGCLVLGSGVVLAALFAITGRSVAGIVAGALLLGAAFWLNRALRGRTPRTAEGSAVRIQALGFKKYLATAEADQFSFEEAAGIFGRYLPWAVAFEVVQHWARVFGEVAKRAQLSGDLVSYDLSWFDVATWNLLDTATDLLWLDSLDGHFDFFDGGAFAAFGGDIVEGMGSFAGSVGDFVGSLDFLDGLGDGCDVGGCIDL